MTHAANRWILAAPAALALVLVACDGPADPEIPLLQTDRDEYLLIADPTLYTAHIPFTFYNTTGRTLSLVNCYGFVPPVLEKFEDGEWVVAWAAVELSCLSPPVQIEPGAVYADTVWVIGEKLGTRFSPPFDTSDPYGTYRLNWTRARFDYAYPAGTGLEVPEPYRTSNTFKLRIR